MTKEEFLAKFPADYQAIVDEGKQIGFAEGLAQGKKEGAEAERERIQAVEAQTLPGHETLIASLKFDGKTTGAEAAVAILAAERAQRQSALAAMIKDAPPVIPPDNPPAVNGKSSADEDQRPLDVRAKEAWDNDKKLRAEFGDNFDAYLAFEKANEAGKVRILRAKA